MRGRVCTVVVCSVALANGFFFIPFVSHARADTLYSQPDSSGDMTSQQPNYLDTWVTSASLGNLFLGKDHLTLTFTMKDPGAGNDYHTPQGVALASCVACHDLQTYFFTDADRTLLSDGAFHTFTVQTATTTLGIADGTIPIYVTFFGLTQYHNSTHLASNAGGTIPYIVIAGTPPQAPIVPQAPVGSVTVYSQSDASGVMTNPQQTFLTAYIDSASLGNLPLGQGKLYITFTMKDPNAGNAYNTPKGICIQPAGSINCDSSLQKYYFTADERALLEDQAFHTFMVETGTTTSTYADGTHPVSVGFFGLSQYQYGTKLKSNAVGTIPYLLIQTPPPPSPPAPPDPCANGGCVSNVLFLPGIEASRLHEDLPCANGVCETKLWEPGGDALASRLAHDTTGASVNADIYVKKSGVIDNAYIPIKGNIYKSFIEQMNALVTAGTINEWEAVPYDWRLTPDQILANGAEISPGKISYLTATSSPYIIQELKRLAAVSKTHKVTIIAHSNGGLVTKALTEKLGSDAATYIDKIVFVAVPQAGTPQAIGALLHGYAQGLPSSFISYGLSSSAARTLATNMPMTYNLIPSATYFTHVDDPIVTFTDQPILASFRARYGSLIHSQELLHTFLTDPWRLASSTTEGLNYPSVGNEPLLVAAETLHTMLDAWAPPAGIALYEIAGWGEKTLAGIDYYQGIAMHCDSVVSILSGCTKTAKIDYRPRLVLDGDGTVVTPSALWTPGAKRYWVDLKTYAKDNRFTAPLGRQHADILEVGELRAFLQNIITNNAGTNLPQYISTSTPTNQNSATELHFTLHSPLALNLYDDQGRHTGISTTTGELEENIPDSQYLKFGEVQFISAPTSLHTRLIMNGYAEGSFTLDAEEVSGETVVASTTFAGIPSSASATATMDMPAGGLANAGALVVDENSDGHLDITLQPKEGSTVVLDTVPPEIQVTFSTTTKSIAYIGTDDSGTAAITATTTYSALKKIQKEKEKEKDFHGVATTAVTARDEAGNTTVLTYVNSPADAERRDAATVTSIGYNGVAVKLGATAFQYKWNTNKKGEYTMFAAYLKTASSTIEAHYQPKKNVTLIMTKSQELDDREDDDSAEARAVRVKLPGLVIPGLQTEKGSVKIVY